MRSPAHTPAPARARRGLSWWPLASLAALLFGVYWFGLRPGGWWSSAPVGALHGAPVRRGPLRISVIERGNLKAADSVSLKCEIEGQTAILELIEEGTQVEEGDWVAKLDVAELEERRLQERISVRNADAAFVKSKQNYEIQQSQNTSDIARAEQELTFANQDLTKFRETKDFDSAKAKEAITLAEETYTRDRNKLEWSQKLAENGFYTSTELEADQLAANRGQILLEQARRELDLLERFELPRQEAELEAAFKEAERELERVNLQAKARIVDYEADMRTNEDKLALEEEQLAKVESQIKKGTLHAPRAGMVVYAQQEGGMRGNREPIAKGTQVREGQEIISIPSAEGMIAVSSLHESVLKQVHTGQSAVIKVDAIPDREFHGRVAYVAVLPDQGSWWANPNLRVYRTDIAIDGAAEGVRPGMSCAVEILVEEIPDTLYVPLQAVFRHGGGNVCFVARPEGHEERAVKVGRFNDRWVQVLEGLSEGEQVLLSPPSGFTPEPTPEEEVTEPEVPFGLPGAMPGAMPGVPGQGPPAAQGEGREGDGRSRNRGEITPEMRERFRQMREAGGGERQKSSGGNGTAPTEGSGGGGSGGG